LIPHTSFRYSIMVQSKLATPQTNKKKEQKISGKLNQRVGTFTNNGNRKLIKK